MVASVVVASVRLWRLSSTGSTSCCTASLSALTRAETLCSARLRIYATLGCLQRRLPRLALADPRLTYTRPAAEQKTSSAKVLPFKRSTSRQLTRVRCSGVQTSAVASCCAIKTTAALYATSAPAWPRRHERSTLGHLRPHEWPNTSSDRATPSQIRRAYASRETTPHRSPSGATAAACRRASRCHSRWRATES